MKIPFGDLSRQYQSIKREIDEALARVLASGWFVLGQEVEQFEAEFATYLGCTHVVGVASGTEAIQLALAAAGVAPGDEVITAANTCVPTVSGIAAIGATPVLVDVDHVSFNLDPARLESTFTSKTRAVLPVHLYGQAADMDWILEIARARNVPVIEDAAQAVGGTYRGRKLGTLGSAGCFSFYPSKNLGAYGDGGAVATNDGDIAQRLRQLRNYGEEQRYHHKLKGINSRLDEVQAAILRVKLPHLERWNERRRQIAGMYRQTIANREVCTTSDMDYGVPNHHLHVVLSNRRDELKAWLADRGVTTLIHYPIPIHLQQAYSDLRKRRGDFPVSERLSDQVLSLPTFPELSDDEITYIVDCVNSFA